jgi:hypothetical protein
MPRKLILQTGHCVIKGNKQPELKGYYYGATSMVGSEI